MNGPDLPQPIYPTGGPTPGPPQGFGPPPGPPGGPGPSGAPPPSGGGGTDRRVLIVAAAVVVLVVVALVGVMVARGGDDDEPAAVATGDGPRSDGGDGGTEPADPIEPTDPGSEGPTVVETPDVPDVPAVADGPDARAMRVAAGQVDGADAVAVACIAEGLEADPGLLDTIEPQVTGVALHDEAMAWSYGSVIMACMTPAEMATFVGGHLATEGWDPYFVGCFEGQAAMLSDVDWVELTSLLVQPAREEDLSTVISTLMVC